MQRFTRDYKAAVQQPGRTRRRLTASALTATAVAALMAGQAWAQEGPATAAADNAAERSTNVLDVITVTAQKREQSAQDVGIAMQVFSGPQLKAFGVEDSYDIASLTPGVHISGNLAGQNTQFTIRGVTQNDFNDIVEAPNATYLDEGYIAIAQGQTFSVFDIERVEILKGPQGTLFGRNATGGLVHYISNKPNLEEVEGFLEATYGRFDSAANADQVRLEGAFNTPITDTLAMRVAFMWNKHEGYLKNNFPDGQFGGVPGDGAGADLGDDDTLAGRATVLWEPTSNFRATLAFNGARSDLNTGPYQSKPTIGVFENVNGSAELVNVIDVGPNETRASIAPDGSDFGSDLDNDGVFGLADPDDAFLTSRFGAGTDFFGYRDPDGADFTFSSDFAFRDQNSTDTWGLQGKVEWDIGESMTLTAITDYKDFEKLLFIDVDAAPVNQSANYAAVDAQSFTQELRLNGETERMRWVTGLYYLNIDNESDNGLKFPQGSVVPGAPFDLGSDAALDTESFSAFGQIEYDLTPELTFIAGARIIQEEKDYEFQQNIYFTQSSREIHQGTPVPIGPIFGPNGPEAFTDSTSDTLWAGNVQMNWTPTDDLLVYGAVKRGVKAGSFNAQLAGGLTIPQDVLVDVIPYKEEVLYSYELGFKATVLDGTTRINGNIFYYDYNDYQAFLFTGVSGIVINADAENIGAEIEIQTSPYEGLDIMLGASYIDAEVKNVPLRVNGPISRDVRPTYTPEWQVSGMVRYEWPAFGGFMSVMSDFSYSDEYFYNLRNFDADKFDSYFMLNARIGWISEDGKWEAAARVANITDDRAGIQGFDLATLCGCNEVSYRPPRWYGLTLKYSL
ncbi:MAG: hypothetical protein Tsb0016_07130 [Sphingomonadales bacterium]